MFASLVVFSLFSLLIGVESNSGVKCTRSAKLDLQLIVDSSGSVGNSNFKLMMQEIADDLIGQFDIGKDKTRVSLFKYSGVMVEEFDLDTYADAASLKKAIKEVKYIAGPTFTGKAMGKALAHYSAKMRKEKETAKACIVFTDGAAADAAQVPAALKAWEKNGVTVFALGIGKTIKAAGLEDIAGSKDRIITVPDFKAIGKATNSLLGKVCEAIPAKPDFHPTACWHGSADDFDLKTVKEAFDGQGDKNLRSHSTAKEVIWVIRTAYNKRPIQKGHPIRLIHLVRPGWFQNIQYLGRTRCVNYKDINAIIHW